MPSNRILVNDTILFPDTQRGVARYFCHLLNGIIAEFGEHVTVYSSKEGNYGHAQYIRAPRAFAFRGSGRSGLNRIVQTMRERQVKQLCLEQSFALVYSSYYGFMQAAAPHVYTVYDMIHERYPQYYDPSRHDFRQFIGDKRLCLERGSRLLAISQSTAKDITHIYPHVDPRKVVVTHLGVEELFFKMKSADMNSVERPYFLFVGHRAGYKNFSRLLHAFSQSQISETHDLRVISPVRRQFAPVERDEIRKLGLEGHVHLMTAVGEDVLGEQYAGATAFVYPSEYEGFGLPILEAFASGTLVATSNVSSMPEVGGDVAFYFNPVSIESIAETLRHIAFLPLHERNRRMSVGKEHAAQFTWSRTVQQSLEVLNALIEAPTHHV